jgi:hypothetical protein
MGRGQHGEGQPGKGGQQCDRDNALPAADDRPPQSGEVDIHIADIGVRALHLDPLRVDGSAR